MARGEALNWEQHGDIHVLVSDGGSKCAIMFYEIGWEAYGPLGMTVPPQYRRDTNKRRVQAEMAKMARKALSDR